MNDPFSWLPDSDTIALCLCWLSSLATTAAILNGYEGISLLLIGSGMLWACAAAWLGGWINRYRIPILQFQIRRRSHAGRSALAVPMMKASIFLLSQAFCIPLYRNLYS